MADQKSAPTPQSLINKLLGTSNKSKQLERISVLLTAESATLLVTANPVNGKLSMSSQGSPSFDLLYEMLDFARSGIMERERRALLEAVSQENKPDPSE